MKLLFIASDLIKQAKFWIETHLQYSIKTTIKKGQLI